MSTNGQKTPMPRSSKFHGREEQPTCAQDGTWLEPESLCYPAGGMSRRAYAMCADGVKRLVTCGIPDTMFSIPGYYHTSGGGTIRGFVTSAGAGFKFIEYNKQDTHEKTDG